MSPENPEYEYIVVGSGAGGGTVAARLAEAGCSVLLLEAGGDPRQLSGGDPAQPDANRLPYDYDVPAFHAFASENEAMKWDFFVRHYQDENQQKLDWKYVEKWQDEKADGILYPRAGTLGGCTAHNAQIFVYPQNSDWKYIEELTGDASWSPESMRRLFEDLENCHHRPVYRLLAKLGINPTRHGWKGWLRTEKAIPKAAIEDGALFDTIARCAEEAFCLSKDPLRSMDGLLTSWADPNDWRPETEHLSGICYTPLTTRNHARIGARERVLDTAQKHPNLKVQLHALATKVLFDESNRAIGVEFLRGERLYRASAKPRAQAGELQRVYASKEVILAGGAFNTPQLLMISGIGPADMLTRFGIDVRVDLPGVGRNLQDRYEIGIVHRMHFPEWNLYKGIQFAPGDPQFKQWERCREGIYTTNGAVLSIFKRSPFAEGPPDLFCMALLTDFQGYYPGYSKVLPEKLNCLTWVVLKARTKNRAGEVVLRSADPLDTPLINFHYFKEGGDEDLDAVLDGVRFVRKLTEGLCENQLMTEEVPGENVQSDEDLRTFIRNNAWGHHASCTCAIGPREKSGVLNGDFQVHGTRGLRVVDASVFPRIPGTFIVSAIYMIAEKAAKVILASR
ncbi:MAG TPA: GMC family oxidoreductase [Terracidiphilus sp.]|nr:GMC family oxidoreductase [Terracidiphilus sp.]